MEPNSNPVVSSVIPTKIDGPVALFSGAWSLFKSNWKIILSIIALPGALFAIAQILFITGNVALVILGFLLMLAGVIAGIASQPATIDALHKISMAQGQVVNFKDQYRFGFGLFWSVLLLGIMQGLITFGSAVLFVIPAIIVGVFLSMYLYTLVIEGKKGFSSFLESYNLVNGRWLGVFGRLLFIALIFMVVAIVITGATAIISSLFGFLTNSVANSVLSIISSFVLSTLISSFSVTYLYKLYVSLKANPVPNTSAEPFKKWLIAFMIIGVIAIVAFFVGGIVLGLYTIENLPEVSNVMIK